MTTQEFQELEHRFRVEQMILVDAWRAGRLATKELPHPMLIYRLPLSFAPMLRVHDEQIEMNVGESMTIAEFWRLWRAASSLRDSNAGSPEPLSVRERRWPTDGRGMLPEIVANRINSDGDVWLNYHYWIRFSEIEAIATELMKKGDRNERL